MLDLRRRCRLARKPGMLVPRSYRSVWQQARLLGLTPRRPPQHWRSVRMTFAAAAYRCGSTQASRRPRSQVGRA